MPNPVTNTPRNHFVKKLIYEGYKATMKSLNFISFIMSLSDALGVEKKKKIDCPLGKTRLRR